MRLTLSGLFVGFWITFTLSAAPAIDPLTLAKSEEAYLQSVRNHLHQHPELGWEEDQSLVYIAQQLSAIQPVSGRSLELNQNLQGGLVADLTFPNATKTLLFRADIDALPILENPEHNVVSKVPGKMHACGHDVHSAMLLTAVKVLLTHTQLEPTYNIRAVWQRAEENPGLHPERHSGGHTIISEGVLQDVDEVYGIHVWSKLPSGTFFSAQGPIFGNTGKLHIQIKTSGGHTSSPHQGVNALRVAQAVMEGLKDLPMRLLGPRSQVSLEPSVLHAGEVPNVMPSTADLYYSVRSFLSQDAHQNYLKNIQKVIQSVGKQYDAEVVITFSEGYPATINNPELFVKGKATLQAHGLKVEETIPILAGEDFSYYLQKRPGVFWLLGVNQGTSGPHHAPTFNPDPSAFHQGVAMWLSLATQDLS